MGKYIRGHLLAIIHPCGATRCNLGEDAPSCNTAQEFRSFLHDGEISGPASIKDKIKPNLFESCR